jgi:hypothetical protein
MKVKTASMPTHFSLKARFALAATVLALFAIPNFAHAQGVFRGAERGANQGARDGGRVAGPLGEVVGGAVGLGVGGAVGGVKGVLGIPEGRRHQCRGYYNRHGKFRCYR